MIAQRRLGPKSYTAVGRDLSKAMSFEVERCAAERNEPAKQMQDS